MASAVFSQIRLPRKIVCFAPPAVDYGFYGSEARIHEGHPTAKVVNADNYFFPLEIVLSKGHNNSVYIQISYMTFFVINLLKT